MLWRKEQLIADFLLSFVIGYENTVNKFHRLQ